VIYVGVIVVQVVPHLTDSSSNGRGQENTVVSLTDSSCVERTCRVRRFLCFHCLGFGRLAFLQHKLPLLTCRPFRRLAFCALSELCQQEVSARLLN